MIHHIICVSKYSRRIMLSRVYGMANNINAYFVYAYCLLQQLNSVLILWRSTLNYITYLYAVHHLSCIYREKLLITEYCKMCLVEATRVRHHYSLVDLICKYSCSLVKLSKTMRRPLQTPMKLLSIISKMNTSKSSEISLQEIEEFISTEFIDDPHFAHGVTNRSVFKLLPGHCKRIVDFVHQIKFKGRN